MESIGPRGAITAAPRVRVASVATMLRASSLLTSHLRRGARIAAPSSSCSLSGYLMTRCFLEAVA
eukprot:4850209-Amphidinium_carterae.1